MILSHWADPLSKKISNPTSTRSNPTSKEQQLHRRRRAERCYSVFKVRRGGHEEIPLIQGKEQQLCFAGAIEEIPHIQGKRLPSKMVDIARGHQRADSLKLQSQKTSQSDHTDHSLV